MEFKIIKQNKNLQADFYRCDCKQIKKVKVETSFPLFISNVLMS